jgi:hypothetical protein
MTSKNGYYEDNKTIEEIRDLKVRLINQLQLHSLNLSEK